MYPTCAELVDLADGLHVVGVQVLDTAGGFVGRGRLTDAIDGDAGMGAVVDGGKPLQPPESSRSHTRGNVQFG